MLRSALTLMHQIQGVVDQQRGVVVGHGENQVSAAVLGFTKPPVHSPEHASAHRQRVPTNRKRPQKKAHAHRDLTASCLMSCLNQGLPQPGVSEGDWGSYVDPA
jgi:hypothetical protein